MPNTNSLAAMLNQMHDMLDDLERARDAADAVASSVAMDDDIWYAATEYSNGLDDVISALQEAADTLEEIA